MKLSICKILFGGRTSLVQFFDYASQLGFKGVEFGYEEAVRTFPNFEDLKEELSRRGLTWSGSYWGAPWHMPEERASILEEATRRLIYMSGAGCNNLIIGPPGRFDGYEKDRFGYLEEAVKTINEVGKVSSAYGVRASVHNHYGTIIEGQDEIDYVLQHTDANSVWFCPDTAHLSVAGCDPLKNVIKYGQRIGYVHLKDAIKLAQFVPREEKWDERLRDLGKGEVPIADILMTLKQSSYDGWVSYEQDRPQRGETALESASASKAYLDSLLKQLQL
ncbi:MAG: sugar phosphate isomerase/epimerase family protein [Thermoprotei archaeon]|jgi:inosose dehydratase